MAMLRLSDTAELYYKDWGSRTGQPFVFSHGWPLSSDAWEDQMMFLAERGYRCIAHDRRGHGRSSQPWDGNDMDTYADDLSRLIETLELSNAILVGHSTGGGEVARYIGKYGTKRIAKAVLVSAVPPLLLKTSSNAGGVPIEVFDAIRAGVAADRAQYFKDLSAPFYGANRKGSNISDGLRESFLFQGLRAGLKASYDCIKAFSETDQHEDLKKFDIPALVVQGDEDQIVPIEISGAVQAKLIPNAQFHVYEGAPHGLPSTHKERLCKDLLDFARAPAPAKAAAR
jgi:non-heme chloroperoxidase